ncbi:hypothetical protein HDU76_005387, partial [Blyttiomyces sp. JEL0837]
MWSPISPATRQSLEEQQQQELESIFSTALNSTSSLPLTDSKVDDKHGHKEEFNTATAAPPLPRSSSLASIYPKTLETVVISTTTGADTGDEPSGIDTSLREEGPTVISVSRSSFAKDRVAQELEDEEDRIHQQEKNSLVIITDEHSLFGSNFGLAITSPRASTTSTTHTSDYYPPTTSRSANKDLLGITPTTSTRTSSTKHPANESRIGNIDRGNYSPNHRNEYNENEQIQPPSASGGTLTGFIWDVLSFVGGVTADEEQHHHSKHPSDILPTSPNSNNSTTKASTTTPTTSTHKMSNTKADHFASIDDLFDDDDMTIMGTGGKGLQPPLIPTSGTTSSTELQKPEPAMVQPSNAIPVPMGGAHAGAVGSGVDESPSPGSLSWFGFGTGGGGGDSHTHS